MANRLIRGLTIQIGADTSALGKAMSDAERQVKSARDELKQISSSLKNNGDSAALWSQKQQVLTSALEESKRKLDTLKTAQKSLTDQLRDGDIDRAAYDKFQEKLSKARLRLEGLKKQQESVEAQFRSGEIDKDSYTRFTNSVKRAELKVKDLETAEHSLEENLRLGNISEEQYRAFQREVENAGSDIRYFSGQLDDAREHLDRLGDSAQDAGQDTAGLGDEVKDSGEKAESAANGGFTVLKGTLADLAADGIRIAARELKDFTADVVQTGMTFEAAMSGVGAISGASEEELAQLTAKAEEMGATTKFTATESAQAFNYMAMAGWKTEDMLSGISGVLSLAAASGESLGTTSDIVTDALTAYGLTAEDTEHFVNVLAAASSNANTNVSMMGETFKYAAPIAGALGYSIEDTAEAIGLMANSGIKASQAGTSLRTILTSLSGGAALTGEAFEADAEGFHTFTVEATEADGTMRSLGDILTELRSGWKQLTEQEKASAAETIAGKNAMSGFLALMNAAPADIEKLSGAIADCDGAASAMSSTMQDNLQGDMTLLESAVDGMKISLSGKLTPALRDTVQYVTKRMPDVENVLEKVFDKGGRLVRGAIDCLPEVVEKGKAAVPVLKSIGGAVAAWKTVDTVQKTASAIAGLVNPASLALTAVAGLAAGLVHLQTAEKDQNKIGEDVAARFSEQYDAAEKVRSSLNDMKDDFGSRAGEIEAETQRTERLWKELQTLASETGAVRDADKERAGYILGELNEALGTEYTMTDNQITSYQQLSREIDTVIEKKRAESYLDGYLAMSSGMAQARTESQEQYETAYSQYRSAQQERSSAEADYRRITGFSPEEMSASEYISSYEGAGRNYAEGVEAARKLEAAIQKVNNASTVMSEARRNYLEAAEYFQRLDEAERAFSEERYSDIDGILYAEKDLNRQVLSDTESSLEERRKAYSDSLVKLRADLELAVKENSQAAVNMVAQSLGETVGLAKIAGIDSSELFTGEFIAAVAQMTESGFDISALAQWGRESGISVADVFGDDFTGVVQAQLDKGYDISELAAWGRATGIEVGGDFRDHYYSIVQSQIDQGYDVTELLKWSQDNGWLTGEQFINLFKQNAQSGFDTGFDIDEFARWATANGWNLGAAFGESFQSAYTQYIYDVDNLITRSINSPGDLEYYSASDLGVIRPAFASGGVLREGEGIVAEAGPELIRIINGAAEITPLTKNARNTPVSTGENRSSMVVNNIGVTAYVSGKYDIRRLGEDLAQETKRSQEGVGL